MADSSDPKEERTIAAPLPPPATTGNMNDINVWISYALVQAQEIRRVAADSAENFIISTRSHLQQLQSASLEYTQSAQGRLKTAETEYGHYEDLFFGKIKEGLQIAGDHPGVSYSVIAGAGLLLMKRPRRFLFRNTFGRFRSDESVISSAEKKVKELRQHVDLLKNESKKLEERANFAEEELIRGRNKLKQAGRQLQSLVSSIQKTESRAKGFMESLSELPSRDARMFRTQVANMAAAAKQERRELSKKLTKIANYGIPV